jgi:hypothetical protein
MFECTSMLDLTRIDLSFLENLISNWLVVIGLELLSLAWPSLGLGSDYVIIYAYVTLSLFMVIWSY